MRNIFKHAFEAILLLLVFLAFYLVMKGHIEHLAYYIIGFAAILYFVPYKVFRRLSMDNNHKVLYTLSSVIIALTLSMSLLRVYVGGHADIKTAAQVLFYVNILVMLYCFLKAVEGRDYVAHFIIIFFTGYLISRFQ